jgi:hypothetical protein
MSKAIIPHEFNGFAIAQRTEDGYFHATAMCKATGKLFNDYSRLASTIEYLQALSDDTGIPVTDLVQVRQGGNSKLQGTWIHPEVAIDLATWCSVEFRISVNRWVRNWIVGGNPPHPEISPASGAALGSIFDEFFGGKPQALPGFVLPAESARLLEALALLSEREPAAIVAELINREIGDIRPRLSASAH